MYRTTWSVSGCRVHPWTTRQSEAQACRNNQMHRQQKSRSGYARSCTGFEPLLFMLAGQSCTEGTEDGTSVGSAGGGKCGADVDLLPLGCGMLDDVGNRAGFTLSCGWQGAGNGATIRAVLQASSQRYCRPTPATWGSGSAVGAHRTPVHIRHMAISKCLCCIRRVHDCVFIFMYSTTVFEYNSKDIRKIGNYVLLTVPGILQVRIHSSHNSRLQVLV